MNIEIGKMKYKITLLALNETPSPNGIVEKTLTPLKSAWASIKEYKQTRKLENQRQIDEKLISFIIRYQDIQKAERIQYQNKIFTIETIDDMDFEKRFLQLTGREVQG